MNANTDGASRPAADFRKKASALGHDVEDLGAIAKEMAGDAVEKFQANASKYYDQGMKKAESLEKGLERKISDHPLVSLMVAAGVGLIAGAFFSRR